MMIKKYFLVVPNSGVKLKQNQVKSAAKHGCNARQQYVQGKINV